MFTQRLMRYFWPAIRFRRERCTLCGACREICPARRLDGIPEIDESRGCMYCYQCVRRCPEGAFDAFMQVTHPAIRVLSRANGRREGHATRTYT